MIVNEDVKLGCCGGNNGEVKELWEWRDDGMDALRQAIFSPVATHGPYLSHPAQFGWPMSGP
jgi:hypothetical protein